MLKRTGDLLKGLKWICFFTYFKSKLTMKAFRIKFWLYYTFVLRKMLL